MIRRSKGCWLGWFLTGFAGLGAAYGQDANYPTGDLPEWLQSYGYEERGAQTLGSEQDPAAGEGPAAPSGAAGQAQANAAAPDQAPPQLGLFQRPNLTGDWGGRRTALRESGIIYRGRVTQFFMGVGGGVNPPVPPQFAALGIAGGDTFEYTGNSRHDFLISLDKFGGLPHSKFVVTTENIWGRFGNVSLETGAFSAPTFNAFMPIDMDASGSLFLTNFMLVQPLSEQFILSVGKTRTIGIADNNIFAGGDGSDQFLNQTFIGSPLMFPNIPFSTFVVAAVMPQTWGNISLSLMDGVDRSTEFMDFNTLFANGATVFGQVKVDTNFLGMPGEQHVGAFYRNVDSIDLAFATLPPQYPYPPTPPGTPPFLQRSDSYAIFYGFDQYLVSYGQPDAKGNTQGWGIFGRASLADDASGNPNWGSWHVSFGVGGDSPLPSRSGKGDRFGIGYAYTATSTEFGPIPQALFGPRDAQNIEMYYRYQLTPAIEVTPDVQWVRGMLGGLTDGDGAIVAGIRLNIKL